MPSNLAQARRNYYGGNTNNAAAEMDSGTMYYNANGSRTGARIDGRVKRKTMMGGASQGPISMRANRSETMEKEAEAEMDRRRQKGIARAQAEAAQTARPANGYDVPVGGAGKPEGYWKDGRSAGSRVYVSGSPPATADTSAKATTPEEQKALMDERLVKARRDRAFSQRRAAIERSLTQSTSGGTANWRMPTKERPKGELAELRDRGNADIWFGDEKF